MRARSVTELVVGLALVCMVCVTVPVRAATEEIPAIPNDDCDCYRADNCDDAPPPDVPRIPPTQTGDQSKSVYKLGVMSTGPAVRMLSVAGTTKTFGTYSGPDLDWYQPCSGGDNVIAFDISVSAVDLASVTSATLTLAVWDVDYNCGGACSGVCERDEVYFNGHRLLTPMAHLTGANNQWSTCSFNVDPSWVKTGANSVLILIDVLSHRCWCVECDWGELTVNLEPTPEIEDIEISPNPTTTKDVKFTAKLKNTAGYTIVKIAWSGDIIPGEGNPSYTVKPAAGTHGKDKNVTATLTYKKTGTSQTGTAQPKSKKFDLFFDKKGHDGFLGFLGEANWFKYWKKSADGACSYGAGVANVGWSSYDPYGTQAVTFAGTGLIILFNAASTTSPYSYSQKGLNINGWAYQGMDNVEFTLRHEQTHNQVTWNWIPFVGAWSGMKDSDKDRIPDEVELVLPGFDHRDDPKHPNSHPTYPVSGGTEEEVYCDYIAATSTPAGNAAKDWANPGKQTSPPGYKYVNPGATGNNAHLGTTYNDAGVDTNGDGKFEQLVVTVPIIADEAGSYWLLGTLHVRDDIRLADSRLFDAVIGENLVTLTFDGTILRQARTNGPYTLEYVFLGGQSPLDEQTDAHQTQAYLYTDFQPLLIEFGTPISDTGVDTDGDGKYNFLRINVPIACYASGAGTLEGWLFDGSGQALSYAKSTLSMSPGQSTRQLEFDGLQIRQSHRDGPYHLTYLVATAEGEQQDALYEAHVTQAYHWTDFQPTGAFLWDDTAFRDFGVDRDGDGLFDVLRVELTADVNEAGLYRLAGRLFDADGNSIDDVLVERDVAAGTHVFALDFSGEKIAMHGKPGPYVVKYAFLYDPNGTLMDSLARAYATAAYSCQQFYRRPVLLTGDNDDHGNDVNGDGIYEYLSVDIGISVTTTAYYAMNARLIDVNGTEIVWASTTVRLEAGAPRSVRLDFDGQAIVNNHVDGPFFVRDLYVYNTANVGQSDSAHEAHTTRAYAWRAFCSVPPVADAGGPYEGYVDQPITLDAGGSSDSDGQIVLYEWDWDNDGVYDFSTSTPVCEHTWSAPFDGTITLRVTDDDGLTSTDTANVKIRLLLLPYVYVGGPYRGTVGQPITFDASGSYDPDGGSLKMFAWDWHRDGVKEYATVPTREHTWHSAFSGTVRVYVFDDENQLNWGEAKVVVTGPENVIQFVLKSHADLHVYDPRRTHVGINYKTRALDLQVPGCSFKMLDQQDVEVPFSGASPDEGVRQVIALPLYTGGTYCIKLVGTSEGPFELQVYGLQDGQLVAEKTYAGDILAGEVIPLNVTALCTNGTLTLDYQALAYPPVMEIEPDELEMIVEPAKTVDCTFTIRETRGKTPLSGVTLSCTDIVGPLGVISGPDVTFDLNNFDVAAGGEQIVHAYVPIPGMFRGKMEGSIVVNYAGGVAKILHVVLKTKGKYSPIAQTSGPYEGIVGTAVVLDASASYDPDGNIKFYGWDWNYDGHIDQYASTPTCEHTWGSAFSGNVRLTVFDDDGKVNWTNVRVTIVEP